MYQVKVYNRNTSEVIMESDTFSTLADADELLRSGGQGEGYYSIVFKLDAVWSDLDSMMAVQSRHGGCVALDMPAKKCRGPVDNLCISIFVVYGVSL